MGYHYSQRILAVPVKGFESGFKELKELVELCEESEDFEELSEILELSYANAWIDTSESFYVAVSDEEIQFFIHTKTPCELYTTDHANNLVNRFKVCVYNAYSEKDNDHDGAGIGIHYLDSVYEDGEIESDYNQCDIDEHELIEGSYHTGDCPFEFDSEEMDVQLYRIGCLAWDFGYHIENDDDYEYDNCYDAIDCFKKILAKLNLPTVPPEVNIIKD